jgi:hypothetical protein
MKRQPSQRELEARRKAADEGSVEIYNRSKQMIPIQLHAPRGASKDIPSANWWLAEQSIQLISGKSVTLPRNRLDMKHIESLQKRGDIRIKLVKG